MPDQVTVIGGTGALGAGLALRLAVAGVPVVIGSRDDQRARQATVRVRGQPRSAEARELESGPAAEASDVVFLIPGLRCVDAGRLEMARIAEALTALLIGVNARYKTHAGVKLTGLTERPW